METRLINLDNKWEIRADLNRLLRPQSIALVGASSTPGSLGESVLINLEESRYKGEIHLVNPKRPVIHGRQCLGSIEELPEGIDCAVLAIPQAAVLGAARACGQKSVGSLIVFSAGFAEGGEAGLATQAALAAIAREHRMILEGPNCLGMVNYRDGIPLTFVVTPPQEKSTIPGAAIISQSGALAAVIAVNMRHAHIPLTYSISTGNEAGNGAEDFIEHLLDDEQTRVLALVVEQFRQPKRFLELARRARREEKYVVLLHPGRSKAARISAVMHTGAIAGDYEVMRTLVAHAGVVHVEGLEELVDVTQVLVRCRQFRRGGVAIFTESGAFKALSLDRCESMGLALPAFSAESERALRAALPAFIQPSNPLDLTAQGLVDPDLYRRTLPPVLEDREFGSVFLGIILTDTKTTALKLPPILDALRTLKPSKPVIFAAMDEGAPFDAPGIDELRALGVPCFPSPERALRALAVLHEAKLNNREETLTECEFVDLAGVRTGVLPEYKSKEILRSLGIATPPGRLAKSALEAKAIAREVGYPVVLKAQAATLPHKSDAGGIALDIGSDFVLDESWMVIQESVRTKIPGLKLDGILVECMCGKGLELILGARCDPDWGPVLLVGFGGVLAEAIHDVRLLPPDLSRELIKAELNKLRCCKLLHGFRGAPKLDINAVTEIVARVGHFVRTHPEIAEIDINPLVVYAEGNGAVALDALMSVAGPQAFER